MNAAAKPMITTQKCLDYMNGQIAFKPDHPDWEIIMAIIERLELVQTSELIHEANKSIADMEWKQ